ncbi:SDR family NAD(P)-dependent oxidoreductase [Streptomyces smyrnaeus]|uniref:SDR family NAD(P)-dependent oxidoreductase n=1 Tax=Streptomyces TaxID=1883 RepID=UPI000C17F91A|nr:MULTISPECIES: SDR family oxidoreductase [unclassified Streptomyces]MBQ0867893.1 SDR family oxidoreductase [Streptomyces sp. RK75]MBQ1121992.1 SDR family oxidoreductase [Streptomyces sp. B15]MBQ1161263.1 SDR family oxidoreductase [Streptomyces sp. A73]
MSPAEPPPEAERRTVLVTGASGGIGRGVALRFAAAGAPVAVHYRSDTAGARRTVELIEQAGGTARAVHGELATEDGCRAVVEEAARWHGRGIGALVNNAGVQPVRPLRGMTAEEWRAVVDTNLSSVFACTQAAAPLLAEQGGGSITHIASIEAAQPAPGHAHYAVSKAAVVTHARAAALEYGPLGVRVNTVSPGLVERDGIEEQWPEGVRRWRAAAPDGRLGTAEEVGDACVFLASPRARWINGHDLVLDGGVSARPSW